MKTATKTKNQVVKIKQVKKGSIKPIPPFKSLEEEANFWDTHSFVDKIDEGTMVGFHAANKDAIVSVRFEPKDLEVLRRNAFTRGIGPTTLVRMWVLEKLQTKS